MKAIRSPDNPFFKELIRLTGSVRQRNEAGQTLLDGTHLLAAYLDAGHLPQHIFLNAAALHNAELSTLLSRLSNVPITLLDDKLFARLSELKTPNGILALIGILQPQQNATKSHFALLLEDIQDPGNLGSILRSAAAAGCDAVFLSPGCADAWSPKVLRAAMGGHFALNIYQQQDLSSVAGTFVGELLATDPQARLNLYDCNLSGNVAVMMGNEGAGLSAQLSGLSTQTVAIPMAGRIESLNVAAATAICLFEVVRQHSKSG